MAKRASGEMHQGYYRSMMFEIAISDVLDRVRLEMAHLVGSRNIEAGASGALHALAKLCQGEGTSTKICRDEVLEWQESFFAWFHRVARQFPETERAKFQKNAERDFEILLQFAKPTPGQFWREEAAKRHLRITFKNEDACEKAFEAAERKHPVDLGCAIAQYLDDCLARLVDQPVKKRKAVRAKPEAPLPDTLTPRLVIHPDGLISLCLEHLNCFISAEDLAEGSELTAYDVQDAVRRYLKKHAAQAAKTLHFDSESSMFCVRSREHESLGLVIGILLKFAADRKLFARHLGRR